MDTLADTPVEFNYLETVAKTFRAREKHFIPEKDFSNSLVRQIAIAKN